MPNSWIDYVKMKAKELNLSYSCALSTPEISKQYNESKKKPVKKEVIPEKKEKKPIKKEKQPEKLPEKQPEKKLEIIEKKPVKKEELTEYEKEQIKKYKLQEKIKEDYINDPENKFMYKPAMQDQLKINPKIEENIKLLMNYFNSGRKEMFRTEVQKEMFKVITTAISTLDFYPTPPEVGELIAEKINKDYTFNNSVGLGTLDMCCGLGSLSLPLLKYMTEKDKLYLVDFYKPFTEILKGLESKNIIVRNENILNSGNQYYNKRISIVISNPPFSIPYLDKEGRDPSGYLYFLFKALDILAEQKLSVEPSLFFVCPLTYFKIDSNDNAELTIPKATLKRIFKYLNLDDKYEADEYYAQCRLLKKINNFKTIRNGKPVKLGLTVGLFEFISYRRDTIYGLGLIKK